MAAIRAAQKGLRTVCIDNRDRPGGTCLNQGCIPSQALLSSAIQYKFLKTRMPKIGVTAQKVSFDFAKIMRNKEETVYGLTRGIEYLFEKNCVVYLRGTGFLAGNHEINVKPSSGEDRTERIRARNIVIATGSLPRELPGTPIRIDEKTVVSSKSALEFRQIPRSLVIVGAGAIGMELGCVYQGLGVEVTIVERMERIMPFCDSEVSEYLKEGFKIIENQDVVGGDIKENSAKLLLENRKTTARSSVEAEKVLIAIGRRPFTEGLGLENEGLKVDDSSRIHVNQWLEVSQQKCANPSRLTSKEFTQWET